MSLDVITTFSFHVNLFCVIAMTVSLVKGCEYCSLAHEAMAQLVGATTQEIIEAKEVVELFSSFSAIADSLRIPCDIVPGE